jgi:hypothetical protein
MNKREAKIRALEAVAAALVGTTGDDLAIFMLDTEEDYAENHADWERARTALDALSDELDARAQRLRERANGRTRTQRRTRKA